MSCDKCGRLFRDSHKLKAHKERKTPCQDILDVEDLTEEKKNNPNRCRFCGRVFSRADNLLRHIKKVCKIVPRDGDTSGMDKLYQHTLKKQGEKMEKMMEQMEEMKEEMKAMKESGGEQKEIITSAAPGPVTNTMVGTMKSANVLARNAVVDQSTKNIKQNITINFFGCEKTDHITQKDVLGLVRKLGPLGLSLDKASERLLLSMAMMIFSDDKHPENITCYLPNKKEKNALVHGDSGWEVMPICLTLSPMASRSVDELFKKQPWAGLDGIPADENLDDPTRILSYIAKNEGDLVGNVAAPGSEFRAIPIRNKDLLERVLANLPVMGDA